MIYNVFSTKIYVYLSGELVYNFKWNIVMKKTYFLLNKL